MDPSHWHQVNITFFDWASAENVALAHLAPLLAEASSDDLIASWFFVRKSPNWRVRYQSLRRTAVAQEYMQRHLDKLKDAHHIQGATFVIYEPEIHAFGGDEGMKISHQLFHLDSKHLLAYLDNTCHLPAKRHRRELSILLCAHLLHAAGLDWYEEGDVWSRVAAHRERPAQIPDDRRRALQENLRRLMSVDTGSLTREGTSLAPAAGWADAFAAAGTELATLAADGRLHRGLRAILAHHVIFAWNRHGLPHATQATLANTARNVVFGDTSD
ncbi:thiopeptide-type bacteriocin biosynthesis protein [Frankia sp. R82]|uniref:thiopeptide-type bacteriocin biosynthesis protein n=1 Tax=Frankia sp. R82 TaxID=2950553 RepID=UPI0020438A4F|nr:thiopeptide-type bacteriocin biosynthesis protein [Frankia sp. R82]MCM3884296.1 thiopeptide-type bacteriocin biosynthesis protein [Frankia sp. R82]